MHGSGPMWIASPSSQWTCTTYSLPVSRRTRNELSPSVDSDCLRECELPANLFEDLDMNEVHRRGLEHPQLPASRKLIIRLRG